MRELSNAQYEQALLSAVRQEPGLLDHYGVREEFFENGSHRAIFRAIRDLSEKGKKPDDIMIAKRADVSLDKVFNGMNLPTVANAEFYVKELRSLYELRRLRKMGQWVQDAVESGKVPEEILETVDKGVTRLDDEGGQLMTLKEFMFPAIEQVEDAYRDKGKILGVPSSFSRIDAALNGFQGGMLYILAARPAIGKTAMAVTLAVNASKAGFPCGFFSCEMAGDQLAKRVIAGEGRVHMGRMMTGLLQEGDFHRMIDAANIASGFNVLIDDTPNPKLTHIKAKARQMKRKGVKIIFIDYLTLIRYGKESMSAPERYGMISKQLKALARELKLPIVVLSQLNREAEGNVPGLHHLRQSGQVEEDADCVIFLHRDRAVEGRQETQVIVAKNRQGPVISTVLMFIPEYVKFEEQEWYHDRENAERETEDR